MASTIESTWARSTMMIETPLGSRGTGFLVARRISDDQIKIVLVTNKHVLHADPTVRATINAVRLHVNVSKGEVIEKATVDVVIRDGAHCGVTEHPDPEIDVLAIGVAGLFEKIPNLAHQFCLEDMFATSEKRKELDITAGEEVIVIGYPSGIRQGRSNSPLIRQGLIATRIGEELHEENQQADGSVKTRVTRGFLFDGASIPGSSGSPVVLKPTTSRRVGNAIVMGEAPPVLLGIVAETRFAPIGQKAVGFAGLGLAFDVETIIEVLDCLPD